MSRLWIKVPGPGQIRGEGAWQEATIAAELEEWDQCRATGFLPTFKGETPPQEPPDPGPQGESPNS